MVDPGALPAVDELLQAVSCVLPLGGIANSGCRVPQPAEPV